MDASAPGLDTVMYREPEDIWIFKVATLTRITNPDHVHNEASALAELHLVHKRGGTILGSFLRTRVPGATKGDPWGNAHRGADLWMCWSQEPRNRMTLF